MSTVNSTFANWLIHTTGPQNRKHHRPSGFSMDKRHAVKLYWKGKKAFNTNALKDHRALGIIDNFAQRIKLTLNKRVVDTISTKWVDYIEKVVTTYNNQDHRSLGETAPNKVVKDTTTQEKIQMINEEKPPPFESTRRLHGCRDQCY